MNNKALLVSLIASGFAIPAAQAASCASSPCTENMQVTAEVIAACTSLTASNLDFGQAIASNTTSLATANIVANCSNGTSYTIELDYGLNVNGSNQRRVIGENATDLMDYAIFQPTAGDAAASTTPWGNAAGGETGITRTGNGTNQSYPASGRLTRVTGSAPGVYSDLVTVTLTY